MGHSCGGLESQNCHGPLGPVMGGVRQDGGERMGTWQIRKSVSQEQRTEKQGPFQQMCFAVPEDVYLLSKTI